MKPTELIFKPYNHGERFVVLRGRSFYDLTVNEDGKITTILENIRSEALKRNKVLLIYTKSEGLVYDSSGLTKAESQDVDKVLQQFNLQSKRNCDTSQEDEFSSIMRGLLKLVQASDYPKFRNGELMAFMILVLYAENNCPEMQPGFHSENQIVAIELSSKLSQSIGLRKSGCYVLFCEEREGSLDTLLARDVEILRLPQPDEGEKKGFLEACIQRYPGSKLAEDLSEEAVINITVNTPNRSLEKLYYASEILNVEISSADLYKKKQTDIIQISEGTLEAVDYERIKSHRLVGKNIQRPLEIMKLVTEAVKSGRKTSLRNIIFCGAPATGKTDLATYTAYLSGVQSFVLNSPKSGIVGESERKTKLMLNLLREQHGIGIIDELEMVLPMNRNLQSADGGVTTNLMGQLQSFLSDASLCGKVSLIATSNKPGDISQAMLSRWIILPVLMPLKEDYPSILLNISRGIAEMTADENDPDLVQAAESFYYSGTSPREMRESIIASLAIIPGDLTTKHIVFASQDKITTGNRASYIHSDLMAISLCLNNSFLPWWNLENNCPDPNYPYPDYVLEVLDENHKINRGKLDRKIRELEPYSNV